MRVDRIPLGVLLKQVAGFRRGEEIHLAAAAVREGDAEVAVPLHKLAALGKDDRISAGKDGAVGVGVRQKLLLLGGGDEEVGPPAMHGAVLPVASLPFAAFP